MRAICRLPGERMFNTRGAPGSPRVFTSAANTAAVTPDTYENYRRDYTVCVSCAERGPSPPRWRNRARNTCARAYVRVAISRRCARAHGVSRRAIFQPGASSLARLCYHARGRSSFSSAEQKLCARYFTEVSAQYPEY